MIPSKKIFLKDIWYLNISPSIKVNPFKLIYILIKWNLSLLSKNIGIIFIDFFWNRSTFMTSIKTHITIWKETFFFLIFSWFFLTKKHFTWTISCEVFRFLFYKFSFIFSLFIRNVNILFWSFNVVWKCIFILSLNITLCFCTI